MTRPATLAQNSKQLLLNSFRAFSQDSDELDLEQIDALYTQDVEFRHPSLAGDKLISVRGITQIRLTDRIFYHEDFYDLGAMIYQHVPVLGRIIRFINQRIGR